MCVLNIVLFFLVIQGINNASSQNIKPESVSSRSCILPSHPSFGWWSYVNNPSQSSSGIRVPTNSMLRIYCEDKYKLDGCQVIGCFDGKWVPDMGQCLKTCPSIFSTSTLNVTCNFRGQETVNCVEPVEGTIAQFKCASYYEDTRLSKSKSVCTDGKWSDKAPECSPVCGRIVIKKRPTLIVHGDKTKKGDFPWQIALYTVKDKVLICGGTLLSERVILTAAHCISDDNGNMQPKEEFVAVAGKYYRKYDHPDDQKHCQVSEIHEMCISEKYEGVDRDYEGDIAIMVTKKSIEFSIRIQPVCIDWSKQYQNIVLGSGKQKGFVSGWGNTKTNSEPSSELLSVTVPSISRTTCREMLPDEYRRFMTQDKFCAGYKNNGTSVCGGDSGGGLVFKKEGRFFIAGVVSLAPLADAQEGGCNTQQYTLYTLVYNYTDNFILQKLAEFKSSDTRDEECTDCTTEPSTTESQTVETPSGQCVLPKNPKSGRWYVVRLSSTLSPGDFVPKNTILSVTCKRDHRYNGPNLIACVNGTWTSKIGKCIKKCPPLYDTPKMKPTCTYNSKKLDNCIDVIDGTVANFKCAPYYVFTFEYLDVKHSFRKPAVCSNGEWSSIPECVPICGAKPDNVSLSNGHDPWHVIIYQRSDDNLINAVCGGSLINTKLVVTAAHCITDLYGKLMPKENYAVTAGKYHREFNQTDVYTQLSKVEKMIIPKDYRGEVQNFASDIAVIVVEKPFQLSDAVLPICIAWTDNGGLLINAKTGFLSGWTFENSSWVPKEYKFENIYPNECTDAIGKEFSAYFTTDKFCARLVGNDSLCKGNSGESLVFQQGQRYFLGGVLSSVPVPPDSGTCNLKQIAIFTLFADHMQFISGIDDEYNDRKN